MHRKALLGVMAAAAIAAGGLGVATQAASSPPSPAFEPGKCSGGYSSTMQGTYAKGGGESSAPKATAKLSNLMKVTHPNAAVTPRTVATLDSKVTTQWADSEGNVVAEGTVVQVDGKWQIEALRDCASE
jgi:hypothetical protein